MIKLRNIKKKWIGLTLILALSIPLVSYAATTGSGTSGLVIAKYKLEGSQQLGWTELPISNPTDTNSYDISITEPGTTVVTMYAEDRAGNQNYQIKSFTVTEGVEDAPVKSIEYRLTGATGKGWTDYTGPFTITNEGETKVEAKVLDEAGNTTTITQTIRLDKTKPVNAKAVISLE